MSTGQICVPIIFRGPNRAATGVSAQHSQCYAAWYGSCPGLKVLTPYYVEDSLGLMKVVIRDLDPDIFLSPQIIMDF